MSSIRNLKFFFTVDEEEDSSTLKKKAAEENDGKKPSQQKASGGRPIGERETWRAASAVGGETLSWTWTEPAQLPVVTQPAADRSAADAEKLTKAVAFYGEPVAGDQVCVCGSFSALDAVARLSLGGRPAAVVASSGRVVWLQTPADLVGSAVIQGEGMRGEVATDLVRVSAELDQEHLFSGQSTPLRILVEGSAAVLPIHLTNGSPQVIELEGGPDQWTETSGGAVNQVLRQVRGIERGTFELGWELRPATCPCAEPAGAAEGATGPS